MDLTTLVTPGAQSLVTAILTESWTQLRSTLARQWARRREHATADAADPAPDPAAIEAAGRELDSAREQALALAGDGSAADRALRMQLFLAGYLAGRLAVCPELADVVAQLPTLLAPGAAANPAPVVDASANFNSMSGTASGIVIQARSIGSIGGVGGSQG